MKKIIVFINLLFFVTNFGYCQIKFIPFYSQTDSLEEVKNSIDEATMPKYTILDAIKIGNELEGQTFSGMLKISNQGEDKLFIYGGKSNHSIFEILDTAEVMANTSLSSYSILKIRHYDLTGKLYDSIPIYISYKKSTFKRVIGISGFIRTKEDEDLGPILSLENNYAENLNPAYSNDYTFSYKFKNSGYSTLNIESIINERGEEIQAQFPKEIAPGASSKISFNLKYLNLNRQYFYIKSNDKLKLMLIANFKFKR